jgi:hypothetical protein
MNKPNYAKCNAQHYIKWNITDDLSLRFYFTFQDRKNFENKYFLKSHSKKEYIEINSNIIVEELIKTSFHCIESFGRLERGHYIKHEGTFSYQPWDILFEPRGNSNKEVVTDQ